MRLLDRYLLRELLVPLSACLGGFLLLWITSDLLRHMDEFQSARLRGWEVAEYYVVTSPDFLVIVLPMALLLALLYALTNHTRHHEISAIRATGISLWRLAVPYFAVGLVGTVALFLLNEFAVPYSAERGERIKHRHETRASQSNERNWVRLQGFSNIPEGRFWFWNNYNLKTHEMLGPQVDYRLPDGSTSQLRAARGLHTNGLWLFFDVREFSVDPRAHSEPVPTLATNVLAKPEFTETPEQIRSVINISSGQGLLGGSKADIPLRQILDYLRLNPRPPKEKYDPLYTKLHGRLAAPWTCLVVVLIAIPFGAASGRRNVFFGVAGSVFICFAYFIVQQLGLSLGAGGYVPPWLGAWGANLLFGTTGIWMTARVR